MTSSDIESMPATACGLTAPVNLSIQRMFIDTRDPARLTDFWQEALGRRRPHDESDEVVLEPPIGSSEDGVVPDLMFLRTPDPKPGKNRLHLDLRPKDHPAEVRGLEELRRAGSTSGRVPTWAGWCSPPRTATSSVS